MHSRLVFKARLRYGTGLAFLLLSFATPALTVAQNQPGSFSFERRNVPLDSALRIFIGQTQTGVMYTPALVADKEADCVIRDATAEQVMDCILRGTGLTYTRLSSGTLALAQISPSSEASPEQRFTISGYVRDATSGEQLIGATVYAPALQVGTVTNNYGFYSLTLPAGIHDLIFSYLGYDSQPLTVNLTQDQIRAVALQPQASYLDSVIVEATRVEPIQERIRMGVVDVPVEQIEAVPALGGEVDVLRALQLLPGVKSGSEISSALYVRGGGHDQNLILLDGVPVYNASHLFGFLSVFNTDAINTVQLTKGGFPARYGGRLSSIVEINLKEGNMKERVVQGSVGLLASRLTVEGPLIPDRTSFIVSGRRTYVDILAAPFLNKDAETPLAYFYDLTAKINHILTPKDRVYFSVYGGGDRFGMDSRNGFADELTSRIHWGNLTSALRWNHLFSNKLFGNTTLTYSRYRFGVTVRETSFYPNAPDTVQGLHYFSGIRDWGARMDFDYVPSPSHYVRFGAGGTFHTFTPNTLQYVEPAGTVNSLDTTGVAHPVNALEFSAYVEDDFRVNRRLAINAGLHASAFSVRDKLYPSVQPRLSARFLVTDDLSAKASFVTMQQYIHLLTNTGVGMPTDLWVPATEVLPPQTAWQASVGLAQTFGNGRYEASLEGYYKRMGNLLQHKEGANYAVAGATYENQVTTGQGWAYGAEAFLQRRTGRTTGWLGYTLSWAKRQFDEINVGRAFPDRFDRRHGLSLTLNHQLSRRADIALTWVYTTGHAATVAVAEHNMLPWPIQSPNQNCCFGGPVKYYGGTNSFRMPSYHRLDLGFNWFFARGARESYLSLGVYNAYNRKNPFFIDFDMEIGESGSPQQRKAKGYALLPIVPSLSYNVRL